MSWNIAALTFPFSAPSKWLIFAYFFFWASHHDRFRDASLLPLEENSIGRVAQQASYIKDSGADVVLLQEVPGAAYVDALMKYLGDDFDVRYAYRKPKLSAIAAWLLLTVFIPTAQLLMLEPLLRAIVQPWVLVATGGVAGRWLLLASARSYTCRKSVVTQFLLGSIAGQLVTLRRRSSLVVGLSATGAADAGVDVVDFSTFAGRGDDEAGSKQSKGYLSAFFAVRPRGVLHVAMPIVDARGHRGTVHVLNTHLPHGSDNDGLVANLGARVAQIAAREGSVVLGGDFNPLPSPSPARQFAPLVTAGCVPTNDLATGLPAATPTTVGSNRELITWDLKQPLTRWQDETPRSMQLDFLFVNQQKTSSSPRGGHAPRCRLTLGATEIVHPRRFAVAGAPLSDHYGLASTFHVDVA